MLRRLIALVAGIYALLGMLPAQAADLAELVAKLAQDDFAAKIEATEALGTLGDGRAIPALRALADGRLYAGKDGKALIGEAGKFSDAATGAAVADAGDPDKVRVNNRLRNVVNGALSKLAIFSERKEDR